MNDVLDEEFMVDGVELSWAEFVTSWKREGGSMSKRMPVPVVSSLGLNVALLKPGRLLNELKGGTVEADVEVGCREGWGRGRAGRQAGRLARLSGFEFGSHD